MLIRESWLYSGGYVKMPIYEYECKTCGKAFEKIVLSSKHDEDFTCPECGSYNYEKIISRSSFVLKGTGWYATDYANYKNEKGGDDE